MHPCAGLVYCRRSALVRLSTLVTEYVGCPPPGGACTTGAGSDRGPYASSSTGLRRKTRQLRTLAIAGYLMFPRSGTGSSGHPRHEHLEPDGRLRGPSEVGDRGWRPAGRCTTGILIRDVVPDRLSRAFHTDFLSVGALAGSRFRRFRMPVCDLMHGYRRQSGPLRLIVGAVPESGQLAIGSCSAEPSGAAPRRLHTRCSWVATHSGPSQQASR